MHLWIYAYLGIEGGPQTLAARVASSVKLPWSMIFFLWSFQGLQLFTAL